MATKKKATARAAFDSKALSEQLGAVVKEGSISEARGRYYLTTGVKKLEIPVGETISLADIKRVAGLSVPVIVAGGKVIAIGNLRRPGCYWIVCYKPAPEFTSEINEMARLAAIDKFEKLGQISNSVAQNLRQQRGSIMNLQ